MYLMFYIKFKCRLQTTPSLTSHYEVNPLPPHVYQCFDTYVNDSKFEGLALWLLKLLIFI